MKKRKTKTSRFIQRGLACALLTVLTFSNVHALLFHVWCSRIQKRPTKVSKDTYYSALLFDVWCSRIKNGILQKSKR